MPTTPPFNGVTFCRFVVSSIFRRRFPAAAAAALHFLRDCAALASCFPGAAVPPPLPAPSAGGRAVGASGAAAFGARAGHPLGG